jgi:predicted ATP-grasp superfamily ATP-dependent carboligase
MKPDTKLPPCIVLGLETQIGLHIVRELGQAGVPVIGIASSAHSIGLRSRYLWQGVVVQEPRSPALLQQLQALARAHGPCCLLAVSEVNLAWLNQHREALGGLKPQVADPDKLAIVLDKQRTLALAREIGIQVPESREPATLEEALALAEDFPFPAVVKWSDPNEVAPALRKLGLSLVKAEYVYTPEQWRQLAQRYAPLGRWPLLQRYCAGQGLGQFFFMHQGRALRRFQHLRVAEWPPEGGFSSVCDALPLDQHQALQERSIALLQRIGWEGVAMVEYRWDAPRDEAVLMEINGRFWGSFPLAAQAGAGFALLSYQAGSGLPFANLPPPRAPLRCRMLSTELKRLVRLLLHPERVADRAFQVSRPRVLLDFLLNYLRPRVCYYVWSWRDPLPFFTDLRNLLR